MTKKEFIDYFVSRGYVKNSVYKIVNGESNITLKTATELVKNTSLTYDDLLDLKTYFKNQKLKKG